MIRGSTFRYRPDGLMINSPTGHNAIYSHKANVTKGTFYKVWPRKANEMNTWNCVDNAKHANKRRVLNHVFSEKAVRSAETYIINHVNRWCELLGENTENEWSKPRDMTQWANYLVFDILGDLCFGKSMETKEPGENELKAVPHFIATAVSLFYSVGQIPLSVHHCPDPDGCQIGNSPYIKLWVWLKPRGLDSLVEILLPKDVKRWYKWIETSVAERTKLENEMQKQGDDEKNRRKDMFHYLFQAKDPETGLSAYTPDELFQEAYLFIIAGTDTTTTTLAATIFYLTRNPRVYARLVTEVRTNFQTIDEIQSGTKLWGCRYLRACLDEAMRMSPPTPCDLTREVLPGGMEVNGTFVPEGTQIGTGMYSFHLNENIFPDPFVYRPERWIVDEKSGVSAADVALAESAFAPFSSGAQACVGKNLAYLELTISLARLLYQLDVKVPDGDSLGQGSSELMWGRRNKNQFQLDDAFIACKQGPMAQFKKRQT
ncbi:hypothetical protein MMC07_003917 [Pseudocyphellaria aurata]|nr:hypothetical protein [Pseudocyphellaria aurata]